MENKIAVLQDKIKEAHAGGGPARVESQHKKGKLTARERLHFLLDEGSFEEIGMLVTHRSTDFGMEDMVISTAAWFMFSPRISLFSEVPYLKPTQKKSVKSWRWH
jgi:acetyl-CoA carboxylase carboxyltransferase component